MTLVDSNVILDLINDDGLWGTWSVQQLEAASLVGPLLINDVIYAEISARYERMEDLDDMLDEAGIQIASIPKEALFLAGKAFIEYRRPGGTRLGVLPDFFIGAHAAVSNIPLLTRDVPRYRTYFPSLQIIGPDTH